MTVQDMHYDFKSKLNKIDSQQYKNLRIPEIDRYLNEACGIFIKLIAEPRINNHLGFEINQRSIDDLRTLVKSESITPLLIISEPGPVDSTVDVIIPEDYMFYISSEAIISKDGCDDRKATVHIRQHDDDFQESPFDSSSFEWKEVNALFEGNRLKLYLNSFSVKKLNLKYIRKHAYIHYAQGFQPGGTYTLPSGTVLTGTQDCELPEHTHAEIVDIAVLIATDNLQIPDYQIKQAKLNLNQIN